ncbi:hypothetical protein [Dactylosporangium darangshiense]|uniref:hypothetical protein n=1 Tax=Dactylosporangium darangshiense TaxID=579108 RepID=UPI003627628A
MSTVREQRPYWALFVALGTAAAGAFVALRASGAAPWLTGALYTGLSVVTAVVVLVATWRYRPKGRAGWYLLGAGQLAYSVGDSIHLVRNTLQGNSAFPSAADAMHLAQYPSSSPPSCPSCAAAPRRLSTRAFWPSPPACCPGCTSSRSPPRKACRRPRAR